MRCVFLLQQLECFPLRSPNHRAGAGVFCSSRCFVWNAVYASEASAGCQVEAGGEEQFDEVFLGQEEQRVQGVVCTGGQEDVLLRCVLAANSRDGQGCENLRSVCS